jgi:hypothetical protein
MESYEVGTSRDVETDHVLKVITVHISNTQEPTTGGIIMATKVKRTFTIIMGLEFWL